MRPGNAKRRRRGNLRALFGGPGRRTEPGPSPFWSQTGKMPFASTGPKKQFVRLADIPYLDRPEAMTVSFFFLRP